jgi:hypothetical protein
MVGPLRPVVAVIASCDAPSCRTPATFEVSVEGYADRLSAEYVDPDGVVRFTVCPEHRGAVPSRTIDGFPVYVRPIA